MLAIPDTAWPTDGKEAVAIQQQLRKDVRLENDFPPVRLIAGIDVSYDLALDLSRAAVVLLDYEGFAVRQSILIARPTCFPYIPGLLSFREIPVILSALAHLKEKPDLLMVDGQGVAHPRRLGIAAHLGVILDMPAIGVAKSRLCGQFEPVGEAKGAQSVLMHRGERIGTVLRSKVKCNPLFISPGHRVDQETAVAMTIKCLKKYRLPEPTRLADKLSKTKAPLID